MTQSQRTTQTNYQQPQPEERDAIAMLFMQKQSCHTIAIILHRSVSTISYAIKCGSVRQLTTLHQPYQFYFPDTAQRPMKKLVATVTLTHSLVTASSALIS